LRLDIGGTGATVRSRGAAIGATRGVSMSFWKKLFGSAAADGAAAAETSVEYKGFLIVAAPYLEGGQYQTAGRVEKEVDGVRKEHRFVRADRHAALEDAREFSLAKGRQIVDEQGERMFR
jgi:hypothetical protein